MDSQYEHQLKKIPSSVTNLQTQIEWLDGESRKGWELVTFKSETGHFIFRRRIGNSPDLERAYKNLGEAHELLVQAFNEWTPTQSPTDKWLREVKRIKENREY